MTRPLLPILLGTTVLLTGGCNLFSRNKEAKPKETNAIASEVEAGFRQRWIDQRSAQLVTQGSTAEAARTQATNEFNERFAFTKDAQKK
jgi:hypothetical protein